MIISVCLNPTIQKTFVYNQLVQNAVNRAMQSFTDASGKGINASRAIAHLKSPVTHLCQLGGNAQFFKKALKKDGIKLCFARYKGFERTCCTLIDKSCGTVTELVEESVAVDTLCEKKICTLYKKLIAKKSTHLVLISGSKAPGFSKNLYPNFVKIALERGLTAVLDYRGDDLLKSLQNVRNAKGNLIIKINEEEFTSTFCKNAPQNECAQDKSALFCAMQIVATQYNCSVVVTRGAKGALFCNNGVCKSFDAMPFDTGKFCINTTASGDSFSAGFAHVLHDVLVNAQKNCKKNASCACYKFTQQDFERAMQEGSRCGMLNASTLRPGYLAE